MSDLLKGLGEQFLTPIADDLADPLIDAQPRASGIHVSDADRSIFKCPPKPLIALPQLILSQFAPGDVTRHFGNSDDLARGVLDW